MPEKKTSKNLKIFLTFLILLGGVFVLIWFVQSRSPSPESEIIAKKGIHWHPNLTIKILGQEEEIPGGIGLTPLEQSIHTHEADNMIHLEFPGIVRKNDIKLGRFFEIWGKKFNKDCIFDKCSGAEGKVKMLVNEKENSEFENYVMRDGDKIEVIFESPISETSSGAKEFTIEGSEFSFSPASITISAGEKVKLTFENQGRAPHNLVVEGLGISTRTIGSGQTDAVEFTAPASGTYIFFCSVPGHKTAGMEGSLKVE